MHRCLISRSWKGPAPELVKVMHELFGIFGSNFWILIFALPGMSKKEALEVVAKIVVKATIEKGKGKKKKKNTFVVGVHWWWWSYCVALLWSYC